MAVTDLGGGTEDQQVLDSCHEDAGAGLHQPHCADGLLLPSIFQRHIVPVARTPHFDALRALLTHVDKYEVRSNSQLGQ